MTDFSTWRIDPDAPHDIVDGKGELVATFYPQGEADRAGHYGSVQHQRANDRAAFALRSIQAHEAMREAMREALRPFVEQYDNFMDGKEREFNPALDLCLDIQVRDWKAARAALALAEKP